MRIEKLLPACKSIIWGGEKLKKYYGKKTDAEPLAETWELSLHKAGESTLLDGTPLSVAASEEDFGENCKGFPFFPVLVKLIDANAKLSVQVHPADDYALKHENSLGKTEMWYIADADEGAGIYLGFKQDITCQEFERAIKDKTLTDYLQFIPVKKGECYFIPAGTIHAICEGCLICEIQQNSNITYRVYDYGRVGADGKERELHVEKALDVTSTKKYLPKVPRVTTAEGNLLGMSKFFSATRVLVDGERSLSNDKASFRCFTCLEGEGEIGGVEIKKGESVFVPANYGEIKVNGEFQAIMTTIRKYYFTFSSENGYINAEIIDDRDEKIASQNIPESEDAEAIFGFAIGLLDSCNLTPSDLEDLSFIDVAPELKKSLRALFGRES